MHRRRLKDITFSQEQFDRMRSVARSVEHAVVAAVDTEVYLSRFFALE